MCVDVTMMAWSTMILLILTQKKKKEKKMEGRVHLIRPTLTPLLIVEFPLLYDHLDS
jgi:hypothetical protein